MAEFLYKVLVIGNPEVGKTSFLDRYVNDEFSSNYKKTLGVDYQVKVIPDKNCTLRMHFWDIAGQEYCKVLSRGYYNGASAVIIVFDITDKESYDDVRVWKEEVDKKLGQVPTFVLGNKWDLLNDPAHPKNACVDDMDFEDLKNEIQATGVYHVSAKTGYQVKYSMKLLQKILMGVTVQKPGKKISRQITNVDLNASPQVEARGGICCNS